MRCRLSFVWPLFILVLLGPGLAGCQHQPKKPVAQAPALARYAAELRQAYAQQPHPTRYAADVGIYVDLQLPATTNRLFVLNPRTGRVLLAAPCASGRLNAQGDVRYSNVLNSCCSSRGLAWTSFEQGYEGQFGQSYRLHGLSASTTNLGIRAVVLHGWQRMPPHPLASGSTVARSWGCPALAPSRLAELTTHLRHQGSRRVLVCLR